MFQIFEGPVYDLVIKQLQQHQNSKDDMFIVCLNKVTKNFPPLADRYVRIMSFPLLYIQISSFMDNFLLVLVLGHGKVYEYSVLLDTKTSWGDENLLPGNSNVPCPRNC